MVKFYLDPGHGGADPGTQGNGLVEKELTLDIANRIKNILENEYDGLSIKMSRTDDRTVSLSQRTSDANTWGADYFLSIHINSGGGTGFESYVYQNVGNATVTYQNIIHNAIVNATGFGDRGEKRANFHVLRETAMSALLTENGFIDSSIDASNLKSSDFLDRISRGHVNGLAEAFQLKKRNNGNNQDSGSLYRVQIGAFNKEENADNAATQAKSNGFNAYVFNEDGLYKVQIGAFSNRENAESLANEARDKGFEVYISQS